MIDKIIKVLDQIKALLLSIKGFFVETNPEEKKAEEENNTEDKQ